MESNSSSFNMTLLINIFIEIDYWFLFINVPFGILLNLFSIYIFTRVNLNKSTMGFYYINLSIWCIIALIYLFFFQCSNIVMNYDLSLMTDLNCKLLMFFRRILREIPVWIESLITFDRYRAVCQPNKFEFLKKKKIILLIIFIIILSLCLISYQNFFYSIQSTNQNSSSTTTTTVVCTGSKMLTTYADFVSALFRTILPSIIQIILSVMLVRKVIQSKKALRHNNSANSNDNNASSHLTKTVLNMNIIFLILNGPEMILYIVKDTYSNVASNPNETIVSILAIIYRFSYDISYIYYSFRFFSYIFFNKLFYDELTLIIRNILSLH